MCCNLLVFVFIGLGIFDGVDVQVDAGADEGRQHDVIKCLVIDFHAVGLAACMSIPALEEVDDEVGQHADDVPGAEQSYAVFSWNH
jgi:hypothetical protein